MKILAGRNNQKMIRTSNKSNGRLLGNQNYQTSSTSFLGLSRSRFFPFTLFDSFFFAFGKKRKKNVPLFSPSSYKHWSKYFKFSKKKRGGEGNAELTIIQDTWNFITILVQTNFLKLSPVQLSLLRGTFDNFHWRKTPAVIFKANRWERILCLSPLKRISANFQCLEH